LFESNEKIFLKLWNNFGRPHQSLNMRPPVPKILRQSGT